MLRSTLILTACLAFEWFGAVAAVQAQTELGGCKNRLVDGPGSVTRQGDRTILKGNADQPVRIDCDELQFFADSIEIVGDRVTAVGHVVFASAGNNISAERMEFDTRTRTGTFYTASGTVRLGDQADRSLFGTQEPDAMFYGETVEKLGPKKYRITAGGFTTCVQPTPRWQMVSDTTTIHLDDYALLTNTVFRVKGVPVFYLPVFYYPMQEDDRATGFLIPTYGSSTNRGQSISNAFFWAVGRSHDVTLLHDWFSKTGYGTGGEYRYVLGPASSGNARVYLLNEHEATIQNADGTSNPLPSKQSYNVTGTLTQRLPLGLFARANADYFSSITTQQRYQQSVYYATNRRRRFGGQVTGSWNAWSMATTLERNDLFDDDDRFATDGALPRVSIGRGERPIAGLPIYFGVNGEYVTKLRSTTEQDVKTSDTGLTRLDVMPTLRIPFTRWPFLTINSAVAWRGTYWTESLVDGVQAPEPVGRRYFDVSARFTGPVATRIFNTPNNGYAEKFKHVIEPVLVVQHVTAIDNRDAIVQLDGADYVLGTTRFAYGLSNRLYAKKGTAREIVTATLSQSYNTNQEATDLDRNSQSSHSGAPPSHFSPVALLVRAAPTDRIQGDFRTEWDSTKRAIRTRASNATFNLGDAVQATAGWSQRRFIPELTGFEESRSDHYLNAAATYRRPGNRIGGTYAFNYDLKRDTFLNQRYIAYYNAQCCGIALEFQTFNFQGFTNVGLPQDRRFNLSFSLGGIGTFSNFFGALGGQQ